MSPGRVGLGASGLCAVAVVEWAGELVAAGLELVDGPAVVSDDMMMPA